MSILTFGRMKERSLQPSEVGFANGFNIWFWLGFKVGVHPKYFKTYFVQSSLPPLRNQAFDLSSVKENITGRTLKGRVGKKKTDNVYISANCRLKRSLKLVKIRVDEVNELYREWDTIFQNENTNCWSTWRRRIEKRNERQFFWRRGGEIERGDKNRVRQ